VTIRQGVSSLPEMWPPRTRIYLPTANSPPACRGCWGLTYESRQRRNYRARGGLLGAIDLVIGSLAQWQTLSDRKRRGEAVEKPYAERREILRDFGARLLESSEGKGPERNGKTMTGPVNAEDAHLPIRLAGSQGGGGLLTFACSSAVNGRGFVTGQAAVLVFLAAAAGTRINAPDLGHGRLEASLYTTLLTDATLFEALIAIDQDLAAMAQAALMPETVIPYKPRQWAKRLHASFARWALLVLHRRSLNRAASGMH
jgi:hypothetical protein